MKNELSILTFLSVQSIRTRYRAVSTAFSRWANLMSCLLRRQTLLVVALCVCSSVSYAQLSGTYTVGSGGTYASFTDAVSALTSLGVSGPVAFNVISGSYNEQIQIGRIAGASSVNTITFKAQSGSAADVTLSFTPTSSNNYVVLLNRATYIRFQSMTFAVPGAVSSGKIVVFQGNATDNTFQNNIFNGAPGGSTLGSLSIVSSAGSDSIANTVIEGNAFNDGSFGVVLSGFGVSLFSPGTQITNNTFLRQGQYPIELIYHDAPQVNGNTITTSSAYNGIYLLYCNNALRVLKNMVSLTPAYYGIYLYGCFAAVGAHGLVADNFVAIGGTSTGYGITIYASTNQDVYYNSVNITNADPAARAFYVDGAGSGINAVNNIFANHGGGYAYYAGSTASIGTSDYNDLYSNGNYLAYWLFGNVDLVSLRAVSGKDANSVSSYPDFTSATDLHTASPWLNAKGTPLSPTVTDDFDGQLRNATTPDIGADEFTPDPSTTTPLAGTYTIGSGGTYATFAAAETDLLIKGVSSSVIFNVVSGTYNVQVTLLAVPGASASNTVTFQSQSGIAADVTVIYVPSGAGDNFVIRLDGADYIHFQNMTFTGNTIPSSTYAVIFDLVGGVEDFRLRNNVLNGTPTGSNSSAQSLVNALPSLHTSCIFNGNTFNNGSYGVYLGGVNSNALASGSQILNNTFSNQSSTSVYLIEHDAPKVNGNTIAGTATNTAISLATCKNAPQVLKNTITLTNGIGIDLYNCTVTAGPNGLVANNVVSIGGASFGTGIRIYSCTNQDLYYNSVNVTNGASGTNAFDVGGTGSGINVVNNIFAHQKGGYAYYISSTASIATSNYNDLYTDGNYLAYWTTDKVDLTALKAASGKDSNSVSSYPNFNSSTDLHTASPWVNAKGTPLPAAVTDDIDGQPRDATNPDIGADEFTPDPSTTTPLAGTYSIGSGGTYPTFAAAVADLLLKGVSAGVTFNVFTDNYNEHVTLLAPPGSSALNTITFQSETGTASDVNLLYAASGSADNFLVRLDGADYIRFQNMTFTSNTIPGSTYALIFDLVGGVEDFQLMNNVLNGTPGGSSSTSQALVYAAASLYTSRAITGNTFNNGGDGVHMNGLSSTVLSGGAQVSNNTFSSQGYYAVDLLYQDAPKVNSNTITGAGTNYGVYLQNCNNALEVLKNKMTLTNAYGVYLYSCVGALGARGLVANNFVSIGGTSTAYGITLYSSTNQDIYYNSVNIYNTYSVSRAFDLGGSGSGINVVNNIFAHQGTGYASYVATPTKLGTSNHNDLYSDGNYLAYWTADKVDLPALKAASGKDANSVSSYPNFTSNTDLHTASPWVNAKGTPLPAAVTDDIDGQPRDTTNPDIGADEFTPDPSTTTPLAGTYSIGSGGTYPTLAAAVTDLLIKGVSAGVTFNLLSGTYNEQVTLFAPPGASATNTITFQSQSGNSGDVNLHYVAGGPSDNYVVLLDGADYIRFQNMTITSNTTGGAPYSRIFDLVGGVEDFRLMNSVLNGTVNGTSNQSQALVNAASSLYTSRMFTGNTFNGGYAAMYLFGISTTALSSGTQISGNAFSNQYYSAVYLIFHDAPKVNGNTITGASSYPIYLQNCYNALQVLKNRVTVGGGYGIYLYACNGALASHGLVANNFVGIGGTSTAYGITLYGSNNQDVYYNSVNITSTYTYTRAFDLEGGGSTINVVDNIFANPGGGHAYYVGSTTAIGTSDYNDHYTSGPTLAYWTADRANLAALKTASGKDAHSVSTSPGFVSTADLHRNTSALDSLATALTSKVPDDIDGELRHPPKTDIGADERYAPAAVPTISVNNISQPEGNSGTTNAIFTATLSDTTSQTVTLHFATANGTATAGSDYTAKSGTLTFPPGTLTQKDTILISGDTLNEPDETFFLNLSTPTNASLADSQGVCTILNDDSQPGISINNVTLAEGNSGTTNFVFVVSLSAASGQTVTVHYATADGSATAGSDYISKSGTITFPAGTVTKNDTISVSGDLLNEPDETFFVNLSLPTNATLVDSQALGTILNDDARPTIAINNVSVLEGNSGTTNAIFVVSLSAASGQTVSVNYSTADGSATAGSDYIAKSGTLTFPPGTTTRNDTVLIYGDTVVEPNESLFVNLHNPANAAFSDSTGICTIINDDSVTSAGSIQGMKWHDRNGNGVKDVSEEALAGWQIYAISSAHDTLKTLTDTGGNYSFTNVAPDTYRVEEAPQANWIQTGGEPYYRVAVGNQTVSNVNFGNFVPGAIDGQKFADKNNNGVKDPSENGYLYWNICLVPQQHPRQFDLDRVAVTMSLDFPGIGTQQVKFDGIFVDRRGDYVPAGNLIPTELIGLTLHSVQPIHLAGDFLDVLVSLRVPPAGARSFGRISGNGTTFPAASFFDLFTEVDFRNYYTQTVFKHTNHVAPIHLKGNVAGIPLGTGTSYTGGGGIVLNNVSTGDIVATIQSITVTLGDSISASNPLCVLSDNRGRYSLAPLLPGTYTVREVPKPGWVQTTPNPGNFAITSGSHVTGVDFGNYPNFGSISGVKFNDVNGNCVRDVGESGLPGWFVIIKPLGWYGYTDRNGAYMFNNVPAGTYMLAEVNQRNWQQTCPAGGEYTNIVVAGGDSLTGYNFGNRMIPNVQDLSVDLSAGTARPGFTKHYSIAYSNKGSVGVTGVVTFTLPPEVVYQSSSPSGVFDAPTHTITWNVGLLAPLAGGSLGVTVQIPPTTPIGTNLAGSAKIEPIIGDAYQANNTSSETQRVSGSFDPNDKAVSPEGAGSDHVVRPTDTLTYKVRFQNVGNDTAFNIVVLDTLDSNLDPNTLALGAASHPYSFQIMNGRELEWTFSDINLVDSLHNESESHGYFWYSIRPDSGVPIGTVVKNSASVYFDFNAPVRTNTLSNRLDTVSSGVHDGGPLPKSYTLYQNYPNPFNPSTTIRYELPRASHVRLSIYDVLGREVKVLVEAQIGPGQHQAPFNAGNLSSGVYFYRLAAGDFVETKKFLLMR